MAAEYKEICAACDSARNTGSFPSNPHHPSPAPDVYSCIKLCHEKLVWLSENTSFRCGVPEIFDSDLFYKAHVPPYVRTVLNPKFIPATRNRSWWFFTAGSVSKDIFRLRK